jgi:hypothetical protein
VLALELLAERKIAEAAERGELDGLPGAGRPLDLEEDPLVPEEMRMANRVLKNAGVERASVVRRHALLEKAQLESRYFGKALRKLTK